MFGKKKIWQQVARFTKRSQVYHGLPARADNLPVAEAATAINQQLQREIADRKLGEDQLKILLDRLEQRIKGQSVELTKIKEQLANFPDPRLRSPQSAGCLTADARRRGRRAPAKAGAASTVLRTPNGGSLSGEEIAQIKAANERLQQEITEWKNSAHYLNQKIAVLTKTVQQLQHEVGQLNQREIDLLEDIIDAEQPGQPTPGLNPQELKALSEMARRLAQ